MSIGTIGTVSALLALAAFACGPQWLATAIWIWFWRLLVAASVLAAGAFLLAPVLAAIDLANGVGEPVARWLIIGQALLVIGLAMCVALLERRRARLIAARTALVRVLKARSEQ